MDGAGDNHSECGNQDPEDKHHMLSYIYGYQLWIFIYACSIWNIHKVQEINMVSWWVFQDNEYLFQQYKGLKSNNGTRRVK